MFCSRVGAQRSSASAVAPNLTSDSQKGKGTDSEVSGSWRGIVVRKQKNADFLHVCGVDQECVESFVIS